MQPGASGLHVVIVSWPGWHDRARQIAAALVAVADRVSVVYSDPEGRPETGAGDWFAVPQEDYFGRKFKALLDRVAPDDVMLMIQADAACDDWPALVRRCGEVMAGHGDIGLWVPWIDNTPFPVEQMCLRSQRDTGLVEVMHTDGIVLGISPRVTGRLRTLDYHGNNMGWGIDWAAIIYARTMGLSVVTDLWVRVRHPASRGYDETTASDQMSRFLQQLTPDEQQFRDQLQEQIDLRRKQRSGRNHLLVACGAGCASTDRAGASSDGAGVHDAVLSAASFVYLRDGHVWLVPKKGKPPPVLRVGGRIVPFARARRPLAPVALDLSPQGEAGAAVSDVTGQHWSCPGQATLSFSFPPASPECRVPLGEAFVMPAEMGDVTLTVGFAMHRAKADLLVEWHDRDDPQAVQSHYVKLDPAFKGRNDLGDYQGVRVRLPATGGPRVLKLTLCLWTVTSSQAHVGGVVFMTRPILLPTVQAEWQPTPLVILDHDAQANAAEWLHAKLPANAVDAMLFDGGQRLVLLPLDRPTVSMRRRGKELVATAAEPRPATLYLGGRATRLVWLWPGETVLTLPQHVISEPGNVELRDMTGSVILARI